MAILVIHGIGISKTIRQEEERLNGKSCSQNCQLKIGSPIVVAAFLLEIF